MCNKKNITWMWSQREKERKKHTNEVEDNDDDDDDDDDSRITNSPSAKNVVSASQLATRRNR